MLDAQGWFFFFFRKKWLISILNSQTSITIFLFVLLSLGGCNMPAVPTDVWKKKVKYNNFQACICLSLVMGLQEQKYIEILDVFQVNSYRWLGLTANSCYTIGLCKNSVKYHKLKRIAVDRTKKIHLEILPWWVKLCGVRQ